MPSIEEAKRHVKASLKRQQDTVDHDAILASLQTEIDEHNQRDDYEEVRRRSHRRESAVDKDDKEDKRSKKFRFKTGIDEPSKKRKHSSRHDSGRRHRKHTEESHGHVSSAEGAHPFPREPTQPDSTGYDNANAAFRQSLFDALADDEGAAYWENVYNQPIHVYARPRVENSRGQLEEMNDDEYAAYVQEKMWEKKHPHIVREQERAEKQRREQEEERTRLREEFVRKKQRAAWQRAQDEGAMKFSGLDGDDRDEYEYIFDFDDRKGSASKRADENSARQLEYRQAWERYLADWDSLKQELLRARDPVSEQATKSKAPSKRIPWPVLPSQPVTKPNIEAFMRNMPLENDGPTREQRLKAERVKWHPDKIQQRFRAEVDEGAMKIVTGVFQVIDAMLEAERKR